MYYYGKLVNSDLSEQRRLKTVSRRGKSGVGRVVLKMGVQDVELIFR